MLTKASQELLNKGLSNLPVEMMQSIVASRIKVLLLLSKEVSPKSKTLVNFESLCCNMDMSIIDVNVEINIADFCSVITVADPGVFL